MKGSGLPVRIPGDRDGRDRRWRRSLAGVDEMKASPSPESAGSDPGPGLLSQGGVGPRSPMPCRLGRIDPDRFAAVRSCSMPRQRAGRRTHVGGPLELDTTLAAFAFRGGEEKWPMPPASRRQRGAELEGRTLIAFGGGAPFACRAPGRELGSPTADPGQRGGGFGSAVGFLRARSAFECAQPLRRLGSFDAASVNAMFDEMGKERPGVVKAGARPRLSLGHPQRRSAMRARATRSWWSCPTAVPAASVGRVAPKRFAAGYPRAVHRVVPGVDVEVRLDLAREARRRPRRGSSRPRVTDAAKPSAWARGRCSTRFSGLHHVPSTFARPLKPGSQVQGPAGDRRGRDDHHRHSAFVAVLDPSAPFVSRQGGRSSGGRQ